MTGCLDEATLLAFMDRGLAASAKAEVDAHLHGCPLCREVLSELGRTHAAPETTPRTHADAATRAQLQATTAALASPARMFGEPSLPKASTEGAATT